MGQFISYLTGMIALFWNSDKFIDACQYLNHPLSRISGTDKRYVSKNIRVNGKYSAGEKIVIKTDAEKIKAVILYRRRSILKNMSYIASSGVDIYEDINNSGEKWCKCIAPDSAVQMMVQDRLDLEKGIKNLVLYLPPYAQIHRILLLFGGGTVYPLKGEKRKVITVYGSSISQGCAASRPGLAYTSLLSRYFDVWINNCAFSEGARGEAYVISNIVIKKECDVFIIEYDHNSPLDEFFQRHLDVYKCIREHSKAPIIFMSRISGGLSESFDEERERISIIKKTLAYAKENSDAQVWFIDGNKIAGKFRDLCLADDRHPNDMGMARIADSISIILREKVRLHDKRYT